MVLLVLSATLCLSVSPWPLFLPLLMLKHDPDFIMWHFTRAGIYNYRLFEAKMYVSQLSPHSLVSNAPTAFPHILTSRLFSNTRRDQCDYVPFVHSGTCTVADNLFFFFFFTGRLVRPWKSRTLSPNHRIIVSSTCTKLTEGPILIEDNHHSGGSCWVEKIGRGGQRGWLGTPSPVSHYVEARYQTLSFPLQIRPKQRNFVTFEQGP